MCWRRSCRASSSETKHWRISCGARHLCPRAGATPAVGLIGDLLIARLNLGLRVLRHEALERRLDGDEVPSTLKCSKLISQACCACATTWPKKLGDVVLQPRPIFEKGAVVETEKQAVTHCSETAFRSNRGRVSLCALFHHVCLFFRWLSFWWGATQLSTARWVQADQEARAPARAALTESAGRVA
jgi:hypothetical protein